ncbi:MAG: AbrB/MazE/SpoVT family DNA-binding domain-containing protein [Planctomycetota bacterium]
MIRKLTKHGDSLALVIDKLILERLGADEDTTFEIFSDGRSLVVVPVGPPDEEERFQNALEMVQKRFGRAMRRLSE